MSRKKPDLLTQQARLRRKHREKGQVLAIFRKPMRESLTSVLPITAIVLLLCFTVTPVSNNAMMAFLVGSLLLIVGMGLFSLGSEMSMIPLGEAVGKEITRSKKVWIIVAISFLIGVIITVAEPDLQVLAAFETCVLPELERNIAQFDRLYLTIDLDVLPAREMPAVSAPAALGVPLATLLRIVEPLCRSGKLQAVDLVEFNPLFDIDGQGARAAARVAWQIAHWWR